MNISTPLNSAIVLIASFLIVMGTIAGLIILALTHDDVVQIVIPILSAVVAGVITAFTGLFTHYLSGAQQIQRIALTKSTPTETTP